MNETELDRVLEIVDRILAMVEAADLTAALQAADRALAAVTATTPAEVAA